MTTQKTTTQKTKTTAMTTTTKTEWTLVNSLTRGDEYSIKYKGNVFLMEDERQPYSNFINVNLFVIKDFERKLMTRIFSFEYLNSQSKYPQGYATFEGIKINYSNSGFADTPWKEIGKKAIAYIDALSND